MQSESGSGVHSVPETGLADDTRTDRDHAADERDRSADERENAANARERWLAEWEQWLDRSEAALRRADEADVREQRAVDREIAVSAQSWARPNHGPSVPALARSAQRLRILLTVTALELARTEDRVARHHDRLTQENPDGADERQRLSAHAQARAQLARATARHFPR